MKTNKHKSFVFHLFFRPDILNIYVEHIVCTFIVFLYLAGEFKNKYEDRGFSYIFVFCHI